MNRLSYFLYMFGRMVTGLALIFQGYINTIYFDKFLVKVDGYFGNARFFDFDILRIVMPFIPFIIFAIGLFVMLGFFTKRALLGGVILFVYLTLFLMDSKAYDQVTDHALLAIMFIVLILKTDYNRYSLDRMNLTSCKWL